MAMGKLPLISDCRNYVYTENLHCFREQLPLWIITLSKKFTSYVNTMTCISKSYRYSRFYITLEDKPSFRTHPCLSQNKPVLTPVPRLGCHPQSKASSSRWRLYSQWRLCSFQAVCAASRQSGGLGSIYHWKQKVFFLCFMNSNVYFLDNAQRSFYYSIYMRQPGGVLYSNGT